MSRPITFQNNKQPCLNAENLNKMQDELNPFRNILQNKNPKGYSTTINGITYTINDDYSITINGTATSTSYIQLTDVFDLDGTYTLGFGSNIQSAIFMRGLNIDNSYSVDFSTRDLPTNTVNSRYIFYLYVAADAIINNVKVYPQLEEGTTATSYVPYIPYNVENAISGTDWKDIACQGTYSNFDANNYDKFQYKQVGNQVFLRGLLKNSSVPVDASYAVTGILPEEARPKKTAYFMAATRSSNPIECSVSQYGEVRLLNKEANTWISVNGLSFFID